ncbi:cytochrome P450 [Ganoderma sinense ZZ0214-1]|uniref:Cytochrome P450 n=1 Tax=Ganoderma sinense ZZ0214-1 TaxID=1077348 RepID=A0A2G8S7V7_9APHY|nr:cytochrome P450 [Ganoderma sinense ZZ0214-1]
MASVLIAFSILFLVYFALQHKRKKGTPFSGPPPAPIIGNLLQLPPTKVWERLFEWGRTYGPIYQFRLFSTPLLVLNTWEAGREMLDGKSALYGNRPLPKIIEMSGFDKGVVLEHDPTRLRQARKLLHSVLQPRPLAQYREILEHHVDVLLHNIMHEPEGYVDHIRHLTAGIAMEISHGHRVTSRDDPFVHRANIFADNFAEASLPNNHIVDWLPFLARFPSWLPGMGFKEKARRFKEQYFSLADEGHRMVKDDIDNGVARPSLTYKALVEGKPGEVPDDVIAFAATQVYTGGADTASLPFQKLISYVQTVSTLSSFILFMVKNPDVQKKAQEEIDRIIGSNRLASFSDRDSLPYTESIINEVLRLRPPVSVVTREAGEDDIHNGYLVEKETVILVNFWGMLRAEEHYPDPHTFNPERWIGRERSDPTHPLNIAFGFGRRSCPGQHLAEELVFTTVARMLALFDIAPIKDEHGNPFIPSDDSTNGGITFPVPFRCSIEPRSDRARWILEGLEHE